MSSHGGVDFALPRGTDALAVADGWAIASYFWKPVKNLDGSSKVYQDKEVGMGLGYFVQIYHPHIDLYTTYGHLDKISKDIPFHRPIKKKEIFWPIGHKIKPKDLPKYNFAKFVKKGDVIGGVGDSGLTWGYQDDPSWDEPHLHFEVFKRVGSRGNKKYFDPFGMKATFNDYPDSYRLSNIKQTGKKGPVLWRTDQEGMPMFSR